MKMFDAQSVLAYAISQASYIEPIVYATQYPDIQYPALIPIDTSANEWARSITYFSTDVTGRAGWFHANAKDIHVADITRSKNEIGVEMADIGYRWNIEELGVAMQIPGTNLSADRAVAAYRAYEEFVDDALLTGKGEKNFSGLIDYPGITIAFASEVDGHTTWDQKDADAIIADINAAITGQYVETLTVELADTILLPVAAMTLLATKRIPNTMQSVLDYIQLKNVYTAITGRPLTIRAVRGLETAGTNGSGRMIVYRRDPQVLKAHIPMTHRFLPVWQTGPLVYDVPGIFRLGGLEIRRPKAVRYVDGIFTVDAAS